MRGDTGVDAKTAHKMKRAIDKNISYGKAKAGSISGDAERVLKDFRASLDDALDTTYPAYNAANTAYSETIQALNAFQEVAGRNIDISSPTATKAAGQKMRTILTNFASKQRLIDSVDQIDGVASKYKGFKPSESGQLLIEEAGLKQVSLMIIYYP